MYLKRSHKKYHNGKKLLSEQPRYITGGTIKKTNKRHIKSYMRELWYRLRRNDERYLQPIKYNKSKKV